MEDTLTIVPLLAEAGLDMIHLSCGVYASMRRYIPSQATGPAMLANFAEAVKKVTCLPVITVDRHNDIFVANQVVAAGRADLVAMGRQSLADPAAAAKARSGRFEDIRQGIACNVGCLNSLMMNDSVTCALNPTLGREYLQPPTPAAKPKTLAVVGGGPGGLQAAITAAEYGHQVTLFEKTGRLGGQFRLAAMPPAKGELAAFINWQTNQVIKLGVDLRLNHEAEVDDLRPFEAIILAPGANSIIPALGRQRTGGDPGQRCSGRRSFTGHRVVIIGGGQVGAETADYWGILGRLVAMVEMLPEIAAGEVRR